ncbi:MAG TPA: hypothetical protein VFR84_04420 [Candidatus Angelobacter sp.]|nr:hypothetical protein [Candidatus Angelobacter sp.]
MLPLLRPIRSSVKLASAVRRSGFLICFILLFACSQASAQADLKQPAEKTDIGQSVKTLSVDSQQAQAAVQDTGSQRLIRIIPFGQGRRLQLNHRNLDRQVSRVGDALTT